MMSHYRTDIPIERGEAIKSEIIKNIKEIASDNDRASVILGAAVLDQLLYHLLAAFLLPNTTGSDPLFENNGPLSTFDSKILFSYRLGLIDSTLSKALNLVRKIRNSFAHETIGCSLASGPHRDRLRELTRIFEDDRLFKDVSSEFRKLGAHESSDFKAAIVALETELEVAILCLIPLPGDSPWRLSKLPMTIESPKAAGSPGDEKAL